MPAEIDNAAIQAFFEQWAIYQKVIGQDVMSHRAVGERLIHVLSDRQPGGSYLDLGCGDAQIAARVLREGRFEIYEGVDLSAMALEKARANLEGLPVKVRLHQADLAEFLLGSTETFDVIVAGYSLHHFSLEEKKRLFAAAAKRLAPGPSVFVVYDVFRELGETRERYLERYFAWMESLWLEHSPRELALATEHIRERDFPEDSATTHEMALDAGFTTSWECWRDAPGFHRIFVFSGRRA